MGRFTYEGVDRAEASTCELKAYTMKTSFDTRRINNELYSSYSSLRFNFFLDSVLKATKLCPQHLYMSYI